MLKPPRLQKQDTIGIVSPSRPVNSDLEPQFEAGCRWLEILGFRVKVGAHVHSASWGYAASPKEKADDINAMFSDPDVKGIICSQGGETANACLPYLDWEVIRQNPKVFIGISDISVLLNAIYHKTGLVTYHGNDVLWGFGRTPTDYDKNELSRLMNGQIGEIPATGNRQTVRSGSAEGRLVGGNLRCLMKLAGTEYWPDFTDAIYFVEAMMITPEECDCLFQQLRQLGVFDRICGVIVGYIYQLQKHPDRFIQMEDVLKRVTVNYDFPILKINDFGHNCSNAVLPVGGLVRLDANVQKITIVDEVVC